MKDQLLCTQKRFKLSSGCWKLLEAENYGQDPFITVMEKWNFHSVAKDVFGMGKN